MAEVHWIKITTNMFEHEKIDFIESLPEADAILVIWIKLLTQAGKCNTNGFIFLTEKIPYTVEMLAHKFKRPLNIVKLALDTLEKLEMVRFDDSGCLKIKNWEKYQNIVGLEKIREQGRVRAARYREKQKLLPQQNSSVTSNVTVTPSNAIDIEVEVDIDKEEVVVVEEENTAAAISKIKQVYEKNIGLITPTVVDDINSFLDDGIEDELVTEAIREAVFNNARNWSYARATISDCLINGIKTKEQFKARKIERGSRQKKPNGRDKPSYKNYEQRKYEEYGEMFDNLREGTSNGCT